jgi:hypothetical protein
MESLIIDPFLNTNYMVTCGNLKAHLSYFILINEIWIVQFRLNKMLTHGVLLVGNYYTLLST